MKPILRHPLLGLLIAALLAAALCACAKDAPPTALTDTTTAATVETTTAATTTAPPRTALIEDGKSNYVLITTRTVSDEISLVARQFINGVRNKTGVTLKMYPETWEETDYEIVIGEVSSRTDGTETGGIGYTSWCITQSGSKFFISAYDAVGVERALDVLLFGLEQQGDDWVLPADVTRIGTTNSKHPIPHCAGAESYVQGMYECAENSIEICLRAVTTEEYTAYDGTLHEAGYVKHTAHTMGNNLFATYTHEQSGSTLHLGYYPKLRGGTLRIISEPSGYLPAAEAAAYTRVADTTFTQIKRQAVELNSAPGMSYIMQVADGSFILIDGGPSNTQDARDLLAYLEQLTPAGQKPTIAAWLITHAHGDHMGLANEFLSLYHDRVELKLVAYNFPTYEAIAGAKDAGANFNTLINRFTGLVRQFWPEAEHFVFHAGQRLYIADAEIEFFFTHEDLYPLEFTWINHTSVAFRISAGGKSVMILGDCEKSLCQQMAATFGTYLKSDMLQLSHHGSNGASKDLYVFIDPDICFWACSKTLFETDEKRLGTAGNYDFNAYLRDTRIRVRTHYHNSETAVIPMS